MSNFPRIYVACLAAYNNGKLHGEWIDLDGTEDVPERIQEVLKTSPEPDAEEWAVHDHEYCGALGEYAGHQTLADIQDAYETCTKEQIEWEPFVLFCEHTGAPLHPDQCDRVNETFAGCYDSLTDWAENHIEETGMLGEAPVELTRYFNVEAFARDMEIDSVFTIPHNGEVFVFWHS